jgi:NitT/TauT family transport system permease protein
VSTAASARPATGTPVPRRAFSLSSIGIGPGLVGLVIGGILWEVLARIWQFSFFPPLSAVIVRLGQMISQGLILDPLLNSLINLAIGFAISAFFGILIGMLMGAYAKVEAALDIYVYALLTAPSLVFAPIFFSVFGLGRASIIGVVIMYTMFIIIVNTAGAIKSVPYPLIEMGRSFCATDRQLFRRIILPSAVPLILAGLRLGAGRAVKGMINGEMFIAVTGLGAVVMNAGKRLDAAGAESVLAVLIVIVFVAIGAVKVVQLIDKRLTAWMPSTAREKR